jgi:hypothetical protein
MIELELDADGGVLIVARAGEVAARRHVASPADVLPLGEALLATPLASPSESDEPAGSASPTPMQPSEAPLARRDAAPQRQRMKSHRRLPASRRDG